MNDVANAIGILKKKNSVNADDAASRYQLAVLLLDEYGRAYDPELLSDAREHLTRAIELRPKHARSHAALGYTYDLTEGGAEQALACFREARRLDPRDRQGDIYVLTLLEVTGREEDALAEIEDAAPRHDVDLDALRRELTAAGMPRNAGSLLLNGFIHARNFFRSSLADEAERILNALEPGRARKVAAAERKRCTEDQRTVMSRGTVPLTSRTHQQNCEAESQSRRGLSLEDANKRWSVGRAGAPGTSYPLVSAFAPQPQAVG